MTSQPSSSSDQTSTPAAPRRRWPWIVGAVFAAALTGAAATHAFSQGGFGPPWAGPGFMHGGFDPAQAEDRADRMMRHLAIEIDATPQQQERLRAIAKAAVKDLVPMREKAQAAHERAPRAAPQDR